MLNKGAAGGTRPFLWRSGSDRSPVVEAPLAWGKPPSTIGGSLVRRCLRRWMRHGFLLHSGKTWGATPAGPALFQVAGGVVRYRVTGPAVLPSGLAAWPSDPEMPFDNVPSLADRRRRRRSGIPECGSFRRSLSKGLCHADRFSGQAGPGRIQDGPCGCLVKPIGRVVAGWRRYRLWGGSRG